MKNKILSAIDAIIVAACWFVFCYIFARWTCHLFRFAWSWPAFVFVWVVVSVVVALYIAHSD